MSVKLLGSFLMRCTTCKTEREASSGRRPSSLYPRRPRWSFCLQRFPTRPNLQPGFLTFDSSLATWCTQTSDPRHYSTMPFPWVAKASSWWANLLLAAVYWTTAIVGSHRRALSHLNSRSWPPTPVFWPVTLSLRNLKKVSEQFVPCKSQKVQLNTSRRLLHLSSSCLFRLIALADQR